MRDIIFGEIGPKFLKILRFLNHRNFLAEIPGKVQNRISPIAYSKVPPLRNSILRNSGMILKKYALLLEIQQAVFCKVFYMKNLKI